MYAFTRNIEIKIKNIYMLLYMRCLIMSEGTMRK